jgi:hypothetical protein
MNVVDRGFLYVGVLSIVALAAIALYTIRTLMPGAMPMAVGTEEIFIVANPDGSCFVFPQVAVVSPSQTSIHPNKIEWIALPKSSPGHRIQFDNPGLLQTGPSVNVPAGGSTGDLNLSTNVPYVDFHYNVDNGACPAWVHVSK